MNPVAGALLALGGGWLGAAVGLGFAGGSAPGEGEWDALVVPGAKVLEGGRASATLVRRTEHAVALWQSGVAPRIVLTGGIGEHPPSEAVAAARVARSLGVPDDALLLEEQSTSTDENAAWTARAHPLRRVVVVTDDYHVFRARRVFARHFEAVSAVGVPTPWPFGLRMALREVWVIAWYALTGRL